MDAGHLILISAGLNSLTIIVGFTVFAAIRKTLAFDKRLVFAGYRQASLIAAKTLAIAILAAAVACYTAVVLLAFWRPSPAGWLAIAAGFTVIALTYGALGLTWAAAFAVGGLIIFQLRTRSRRQLRAFSGRSSRRPRTGSAR